MTRKSSRKSILGYTDRATVKLDFDGEKFRKVKYWADRTMKHFRLGGYVILKSSRDHYRAVFNRAVSWEENGKIMAWVALLSRNWGVEKVEAIAGYQGCFYAQDFFQRKGVSQNSVQ